jgi:NAD(P)-dependent dehydrogenase (short-subunit alcohol dehydrogenase family)
LNVTRGSVINIGCIQSFVTLPNSAAYTASKRALTKALAIELSPHGVRVNAIAPGMIATKLNADARRNPDYMANFAQRSRRSAGWASRLISRGRQRFWHRTWFAMSPA